MNKYNNMNKEILEQFQKKLGLSLVPYDNAVLDALEEALKAQQEDILKSKISKKELYVRGLSDEAIAYINN